ncbi:hypothetical protein CUMW_070370 [Citrus unshiu]|nr:hypothetical protein CUMW_070370 [Citrus unshiu]
MAEIHDRPGLYLQITNKLHRRRNSRRRLSVAPASTPAASALQLISFGLRANLTKTSYQEEKTENGGKRKKGKSDKDNGRDTRSAGPLFNKLQTTSPEA